MQFSFQNNAEVVSIDRAINNSFLTIHLDDGSTFSVHVPQALDDEADNIMPFNPDLLEDENMLPWNPDDDTPLPA